MDILKAYQGWLDHEYKDAERAIKLFRSWTTPKEIVNSTLQRALGVFFFIQHLGFDITYQELEAIYESFKEKVEKLLDK